MVLIPLKSQFVSLIFTTISLLAELSLLRALRHVQVFFECQTLKKGKKVSVANHVFRVKLCVMLTTITFFAFEIIMSFLSDPGERIQLVSERCVAVDSIIEQPQRSKFGPREDVTVLNCMRADESVFSMHSGNYSLESRQVQCSDQPTLQFPTTHEQTYPVGNPIPPSPENNFPDPAVICPNQFPSVCTVISTVNPSSKSNRTTVRISDAKERHDMEGYIRNQSPILHFDTTLFFTGNASSLFPQFAEHYMELLGEGILDPFELRRSIFLRTESTNCLFKETSEATDVPLAFLYSAIFIWIACFTSSALSWLLRSKIFYDMSNPFHWAQHTRHNAHASLDGNALVESVYEHGTYVTYVAGKAQS